MPWLFLSLINSRIVVRQMLKAIPDQDVFYDVSDALEEQGLEKIIQFHMNQKSADRDLIDQFKLYEAALRHEDGAGGDNDALNQLDNIR
jgi:hypothetical protein